MTDCNRDCKNCNATPEDFCPEHAKKSLAWINKELEALDSQYKLYGKTDAPWRDAYGALNDAKDIMTDRINGGWISIEDRMPEDGTDKCLICLNTGYVTVAIWNWTKRGWMGLLPLQTWESITHWMPLPVAPPMESAIHDNSRQ